MSSSIESAFEAVRSGDLEALGSLLRDDPTLAAARNESGLSLVLQACYYQRPEVVQRVLAAGPDLDIFEVAAVPSESKRGAVLLAADPGLAASWSPDGFTPLHLASYFNHEGMARILIEGGADPDAISRNGMALRPLHSACAAGAAGIVKVLLERGVDVNARQHGGWTALHSAVNRGDCVLTELLLKHGADPAAANDVGQTSLKLAAERGLAEIGGMLSIQPLKTEFHA